MKPDGIRPSRLVISRNGIDAVAFDLDGVITDTATLHERAWKQVFDGYLSAVGLRMNVRPEAFSHQDYLTYLDGRPRLEGIRLFLRQRVIGAGDTGEVDESVVAAIAQSKNSAFLEILTREGVEALAGSADLVEHVRRSGMRTALVTASKNAVPVLKAAGLARLFDVRVDGTDLERLRLRGKPTPDSFLEAARQLRLPPARIAIIEDALSGVAAGRAGSFGLVIGVARDGKGAALRDAGADAVVSSLTELAVGFDSATHAVPIKAAPAVNSLREVPASSSSSQEQSDKGSWTLSYDSFDATLEGRREALLSLANGYFGTRGSASEATPDGIHYPGTYLAGGYNRHKGIAGSEEIELEDLVNWPNWLMLAVRAEDAPTGWISPQDAERILHYRQEIDLRRGLYRRTMRFRDQRGRITRLEEHRFVHMREAHLAGLRVRITAENWSGGIVIRSALDGRVANSGVARYRPFDTRHFEVLGADLAENDVAFLDVQTLQSRLRLVEAARTRLYQDGEFLEASSRPVREDSFIGQDTELQLQVGKSVDAEKIVALYTSRDTAITDPRVEAVQSAARAGRFADLARSHSRSWIRLWRKCDLSFLEFTTTTDHRVHRIVRLHIFHLLQTASPNTTELDVGVPARGWTGEGYRGHIFWDELFVFPFLTLRLPKLTRALLLYRWRRLPEARWAALEAGYRGAMFPWQSGSNGREETHPLLLNPRSGRWMRDHTHLQRHVGAAVVYNVWQYFSATGDAEFLYAYGAELMFEVARFWSSIARWNEKRQRYDIEGVLGPDEFHDAYPDADRPGLRNNAYTNVMAAWCLERALHLFTILPDERCQELCYELGLTLDERKRWDHVSRKLFIPFHGDGIISQFEGYEALDEFDWELYRGRYPNIMRLDRLLEAEGDTANRYKLSKQADVLMLFFLLSAESLSDVMHRLDYRFDPASIPRNIDYYLARTSHGSTLSGVVHAWVTARADRRRSWELFREAVESDISDIQGGTTAEGIHIGAMAGTVDLLQRCYTGLELRGEDLVFNPVLPESISQLRFRLRYRGHSLFVEITSTNLHVTSDPAEVSPINIVLIDRPKRLAPGDSVRFNLSIAEAT